MWKWKKIQKVLFKKGKKMSKDLCRTCGVSINLDKYNPYNRTFGFFECRNTEQKMCKKCAEKFVVDQNSYKGGRWEVCRCTDGNERDLEIKSGALDFIRSSRD
jgi:hypothetical protein